jgi:hypothetical protein
VSVDPSASPGEQPTSERATSFLVRIWKEPGGPDGTSILRGYYRNLKTGDECYVADPQALCEILQVDQPKTSEIDMRHLRH